MHEKGAMFPLADSQGRLECKDLWGGIRNRDIEVAAGKVIGSIYSAPCCESDKGGDIYYFGVCKGDTITRLAIADVAGHGETVSEISQYRTGRLRDGTYSAMLSFVLKMAISLGLFLCGIFLDWVGFDPDAKRQAPDVACNLMKIAFLGGSAITLFAVLLISLYPINRRYMDRIKAGICPECGLSVKTHAPESVSDDTASPPTHLPTEPPQDVDLSKG